MENKTVIILVIAFLVAISTMMFFYFRAQQKKAELELEKAQLEAITGIDTGGGGLFGGGLGASGWLGLISTVVGGISKAKNK